MTEFLSLSMENNNSSINNMYAEHRACLYSEFHSNWNWNANSNIE